MFMPLINRLEQADSGLFIQAPEGTCQQVAEALGDASKSHAGLTEAEDCQLAIEQLAIQLAVEPAHTIAATLEAASRLIGEPIYLLIDRAERLEQSDLTYALKAARDALASSELAGLRLAFFSTDRAALKRMTRRQSAPFFCAQILDVADELSWEQAEPVGLEFGSMTIDLQTRELTRRNALWALGNPEKRETATQDLLRVWRSDRDCPIGPAAGLSVDEIRNLVPTFVEEGTSALVRYSEIPEPWATRFQVASLGATRALDGYYARNWERFLDLWPAEAEQIEALVELELERLVIAGIQKAQARSAASLAALGIDSDELGEWVAEQVNKGRWPEGDLLAAFRAWRDQKIQKNTSNAVLIIDLENTCMPESERPADYHHQIIEIGAAWVTPTGELLAKFSTLVQAENPVTPFCTELLGITQADVDGGLPFAEAMQALARFSSLYSSTTWASWGAADLKSLNADCAHHGLESPLAGWTHRNLKKEWAKARKINQVGMKKALELDKIALEGTHHRALDDVLNIVKLMPRCGNQKNTSNAAPDTES